MNPRFFKHLTVLMSIAAVPVVLGATAVQAETLPTPALERPTVTSTSAQDLTNPTVAQTATDPASPTNEQVAQQQVAQQVAPGRATRSGPSYIGIGGNIGLGGSTALGDSSFAVISKIGLTNTLSLRPGVAIAGDPTVLVPITADFPIAPIGETVDFDVAPYIGGGVAISTGGSSTVRPLVTAGIDVPVADRVTLTAQGNVAFFDDTEVGLILGVGYNF